MELKIENLEVTLQKNKILNRVSLTERDHKETVGRRTASGIRKT